MSDITIPKPPRPFRVDRNRQRLALYTMAARLDLEAEAIRAHGFIASADEKTRKAAQLREAA